MGYGKAELYREKALLIRYCAQYILDDSEWHFDQVEAFLTSITETFEENGSLTEAAKSEKRGQLPGISIGHESKGNTDKAVSFVAPSKEDEVEAAEDEDEDEAEEKAEPRAGAGMSAEDTLAMQMGAVTLTETHEPKLKLKVLSLFDGISCARVALHRAGYEDVDYYASEVDEFAIKVAMKNWPDTHQLGNVLGVEPMDDLFLLIGGPPCQVRSFSSAYVLGERILRPPTTFSRPLAGPLHRQGQPQGPGG